jgi:Kdo2-lipid IVA lauroyltransferase/acyltransferase
MKGRLIYFMVIYPLSRCQDVIIDVFASVLFFLLFYVIRYRRKIVFGNLSNSFPEKTQDEIAVIARKFYRHLSNVFFDGVRAFAISKDDLRNKLKCENPEVLRKHYDEGKSVVVTVGHYSSWELFLAGINLFIRHRAAVIYQPLTDAFLDRKLRETRSDFRTVMVSVKDVRAFFSGDINEPHAVAFAIDQSPSKPDRCYWMEFLHQDTPVHYGAEKYAKEFNLPVYFAGITPIGKHRYTLRFELVTTDPANEAYGFITEKSTQLLEEQIRRIPELWLWSHRRWKHKRK